MGRATGPTAARDLNDAFGALLNAQNALLKIWLEFEIQRMRIEFDLGVMPLDEQGMWPLDDQGRWIHSEFVEGENPATLEAPDLLQPDIELGPLPDLPAPPRDLIRPAAALLESEGAVAQPEVSPPEAELLQPAKAEVPLTPTDLRDIPKVYDADRPRRRPAIRRGR